MTDIRRGGSTLQLTCTRTTVAPAWLFWSSLDFAWRVRQLLFHLSASLSLDYICLCLLFYLCLECVYLCSVSQSVGFICLSLLSIAFGPCLHWALFHSVWTSWAQVCSTAFGLCLFCIPVPAHAAGRGLPLPCWVSVCIVVTQSTLLCCLGLCLAVWYYPPCPMPCFWSELIYGKKEISDKLRELLTRSCQCQDTVVAPNISTEILPKCIVLFQTCRNKLLFFPGKNSN